jgi:hypothetical protein
LSPQFCSIYQPYYWWHERLWKLEAVVPFSGTPFRNLIWRLLACRCPRCRPDSDKHPCDLSRVLVLLQGSMVVLAPRLVVARGELVKWSVVSGPRPFWSR